MANYNPPIHKTSKVIEEKIIKDYLSNEKVKDISKKYSIHESTITNIIKRNNIPFVSNRSRCLLWNDPNFENIIIDEWKKLKSIRKTANKLNVGTTTITKILKKHNIYYKSKIILTNEQKYTILKMYKKSISIKDIGKHINISYNIVPEFLKNSGYETKKKSRLDGYDRYVDIVRGMTNRQYKKYIHIINKHNLKKGNKHYHIDHIYSVYYGFVNNIDPEIISHYTNLRMLHYVENIKKGKRSDKSMIKLLKDYYKN